MYTIRAVDPDNEDTAETLADLHRATFLGGAVIPEFSSGAWWLAHDGTKPVAFAGVVPAKRARNAGYFCRVGVLSSHRGRALQLRLMRAIESHARRTGWRSIISDTTDNVASANNFIRAGYKLYAPEVPWAWPNTLYWRKCLLRK
ncbi:GNAT family N-acetyltransferase [Bradyrhizobium arachidis]|uniref:GNAT family N-acetyltransferase n=1 Tax=Bradyrhizobium arachidis TaxID=858423 RepID=UPI00216384A7|nr:GNAT family N-acetyltransferase [Bradyrhizobium arachidis]UVO31720.1 GNAT family N-acetyltransferase [Bradyrhizobium arachidis]